MSFEPGLPTESTALSTHDQHLHTTHQSSVTPVRDVQAVNGLDTPLAPYGAQEQGQHDADSGSASR
jgi:hypothetical protein